MTDSWKSSWSRLDAIATWKETTEVDINVTGFMETVPNRTLEATRLIYFKDFKTL